MKQKDIWKASSEPIFDGSRVVYFCTRFAESPTFSGVAYEPIGQYHVRVSRHTISINNSRLHTPVDINTFKIMLDLAVAEHIRLSQSEGQLEPGWEGSPVIAKLPGS